MTDFMTQKQRSRAMSRIPSSNTKPEKLLRSKLHKLGFRFRINSPNLPGKPDIVLRKYKAVIFVHGCFWHNHKGCKKSKLPNTRNEFWRNKIYNTTLRDKRNIAELIDHNWRVAVVWECGTKNKDDLNRIICRLSDWLTNGENHAKIELSSI